LPRDWRPTGGSCRRAGIAHASPRVASLPPSCGRPCYAADAVLVDLLSWRRGGLQYTPRHRRRASGRTPRRRTTSSTTTWVTVAFEDEMDDLGADAPGRPGPRLDHRGVRDGWMRPRRSSRTNRGLTPWRNASLRVLLVDLDLQFGEGVAGRRSTRSTTPHTASTDGLYTDDGASACPASALGEHLERARSITTRWASTCSHRAPRIPVFGGLRDDPATRAVILDCGPSAVRRLS